MPFQYILANLLAETGAVGVLFLDETGETVDVACSDYSPYDMRVLGAYLGIYLRRVGDVLEGARLGKPTDVHVERDGLHVYATMLPDDYYLVLVQRRPTVTAAARKALEKAGGALTEELF